MLRITNLCNDFVFKFVFSQETFESREGLKGVLSTFLELKVNDVTIKNSEMTDPDENAKRPRLDLVVELDDGTLVDVEMQMTYDSDIFAPRMEYYHSKLFASQHIKGMDYDELRSCYVVTFLNGILHPDQEEFYNRYSFQNQYHQSFYPDQKNKGELIVIEMPKLNQDKLIDQMTEKERMIYYFLNCQKGMKDSKIKEIIEKEQAMKMIEKQYCEITDDQWERINREFDELRQNEIEVTKRKKVEKLIREEVDKAKASAIQEGISQGKLEMARNLKLNGVSDDIISNSSGLSLEEIQSL